MAISQNGIVVIKGSTPILKYSTHLNHNSNEYYKLIKDIQLLAKLNGEEVIIRKATRKEFIRKPYPFKDLFILREQLEEKYSSPLIEN